MTRINNVRISIPEHSVPSVRQFSRGNDGLSAYQIAVKNGFRGSEKEWIVYLKGDKGDQGLSAYEVALLNGFVGSEEAWLESLKGAIGPAGRDGKDGKDGKDGVDGLSAYEIAVKYGYVGTEEEWVEKVQGNKVIPYSSKGEFPNIGTEGVLYVDKEESASYYWNQDSLRYICVGRDWTAISIISGN